jgi:hypothetical protein
MFDFLKKSFPELRKESPYYIQAMAGIITKPHDVHEPLDGQDVFLEDFFIGQINRMPSGFDPLDSCYYRGFYLQPVNNVKKIAVDEIYNKIQKAIEDEANAVYSRIDLCMVDKSIVDEIADKMNKIQSSRDKSDKIHQIVVDKNEVAMQFFYELTDLIFVNFQQLFKEMKKKDIFPNIYLYLNDQHKCTIEIRTEEEGYPEKQEVTRIYFNDCSNRTMYATNRKWPERDIGKCAFSENFEMYPAIEDLRKHYQGDNITISNDDLKKAIINDIATQIIKSLNNKIDSYNHSISSSEQNYNIQKEN